ncbi:MAG TPA: sigma-70 family RNA polymerase sigma factor [Patescibacteria group bacterium]|nr:sigma-70 family RNA polymerase sigma factor [Patescibacteria group bacterium]
MKQSAGIVGADKKYLELTDEELILRVQDGESQAFDILVNRFKNKLYNYLFRLLGDESLAEEYAQETFVKAYINAEKYRTVARFSTWLYTIATNLVRNRIRNIKRRPATVSLWSVNMNGDDGKWMDLRDESQRPDHNMEQKNLNELIQVAIEKIPAKYRPSFVLREINDLSYEEIAATTGLKLGTVRSRINRGRMYFKKAVEPLLGKD